MCRIRCCTFKRVIKKEGKKLSILSDKILPYGSLDTKLDSILLRKTSLLLKWASIVPRHVEKIYCVIWARSWLVEFANTSATLRVMESTNWESFECYNMIEISSIASCCSCMFVEYSFATTASAAP